MLQEKRCGFHILWAIYTWLPLNSSLCFLCLNLVTCEGASSASAAGSPTACKRTHSQVSEHRNAALQASPMHAKYCLIQWDLLSGILTRTGWLPYRQYCMQIHATSTTSKNGKRTPLQQGNQNQRSRVRLYGILPTCHFPNPNLLSTGPHCPRMF